MKTTKAIVAKFVKQSGHYIDHEAQTIYVSKEFARKANLYGTNECAMLDEMMKLYSSVEVYAPKREPRFGYFFVKVHLSAPLLLWGAPYLW